MKWRYKASYPDSDYFVNSTEGQSGADVLVANV